MNSRYLFKDHEVLVDQVIAFFTAKATDPALFEQIKSVCATAGRTTTDTTHDTLMGLGYLSLSDFLHFASQRVPRQGIPTAIVGALLERLRDKAILTQDEIFTAGSRKTYMVNDGLATFLYERHLIKNLVFGFGYIAERYKSSVLKILVTTEKGDAGIGTGLLYTVQDTSLQHRCSLVITNRHVAEHQDNLQVLDSEDRELPHERVFLSDECDAAAILLRDVQDSPGFHFSVEAKVLDDIVIAGYPPVPRTNHAYQIVHRGEINAVVNDYGDNEIIIFSAKTSPGNSGGPVIDELGMVVGIVTEQLYEKDAFQERGQLPYFAAVPSRRITGFLHDSVVDDLPRNLPAQRDDLGDTGEI